MEKKEKTHKINPKLNLFPAYLSLVKEIKLKLRK